MRTSPSRAAILAARSLHLVDIENLVGDPRADAETVLATFDRYLAAARWKPGDHVVVAANPGLMQKVAFDLPVPANMHCARGRDGADGKLLSTVQPRTISTRYGRLVIGSGDGIFAARAQEAATAGLVVDVVSRIDGCARRLLAFAPAHLDPAPAVVLAA